jgi:hypothetical protein
MGGLIMPRPRRIDQSPAVRRRPTIAETQWHPSDRFGKRQRVERSLTPRVAVRIGEW